MAVTAAGTPYVESSDLVANYPGASLALANRVDQVMQAPTQNAQTGTTYTAALLDAGKTVTLSNASAVTLTIPAQATVAWAADTQLNFLNIGAGTVTITPAATVTINGTPLTLATSKGGSLVRTQSNTWTFTPSGGGGKVLQVVSVTKINSFSSSSTSFVDVTDLSLTITPASSSNKILVLAMLSLSNTLENYNTGARVIRGASTVITGQTGTEGDILNLGHRNGTSVFMHFDSPATTSATTYKIQLKNEGGSTSAAKVNDMAGFVTTSSFTVIEVAA